MLQRCLTRRWFPKIHTKRTNKEEQKKHREANAGGVRVASQTRGKIAADANLTRGIHFQFQYRVYDRERPHHSQIGIIELSLSASRQGQNCHRDVVWVLRAWFPFR